MPHKSVLKDIKPAENILVTEIKLALGESAFDPLADLVIEGRYLAKKKTELTDWQQRVEDWQRRLSLVAADAVLRDDADWFCKVAKVIDYEKKWDDKEILPLHRALVKLAEPTRTVPYTIDKVREHLKGCPGCREYDDSEIGRACRKLGLKLSERIKGHKSEFHYQLKQARTIRTNEGALALVEAACGKKGEDLLKKVLKKRGKFALD